MKKGLLNFFKAIEPSKDKKILHTAYDAFFTFAFAPNETTHGGVHIRDGMDLKRLMFHVVIALQLCYLFGTWNIGHQHFVAMGEYTAPLAGLHLKVLYGLVKVLPIFVVANVVGLGIEFLYAAKKGHAVEEGFLVSGALIPLIMPPDIPLWILALSVAFAVIIGKEAFGGTGMNIWNIALLSRVFIFFAYPTTISGDQVWIAGFEKISAGTPVEYGWFFTSILNPALEFIGSPIYDVKAAVVDGVTGATPLGLAMKGGWAAVTEHYTSAQMIFGTIPGSIGESSKILILAGIVFLIFTKVADWRIIISVFVGAAVMGLFLNAVAPGLDPAEEVVKFMSVPWYNHFIMGSLLFAAAFMATDPVTAASTGTGKYIYGFLIGAVGIIVRVMNPGYPEGWMLAILFMNTFAPMIDYYVLKANMNRRAKRAVVAAS
ncbi:MAG: NADH:ubiquinone reductase (Na(+)-transporting) subunit B [Bacteroidota bacterium]